MYTDVKSAWKDSVNPHAIKIYKKTVIFAKKKLNISTLLMKVMVEVKTIVIIQVKIDCCS